MSDRPLRLGIVGCGNVLTAYGPAIQQLRVNGLAEPALACGRESQRHFAATQLRSVRFTTEPDDVLHSSEVDAVVILTSMPQHARLARAALEAGKHVFVEKPLATSLNDAKTLVELVERSPGILVCAPFTTLSPTFQIISSRLRRGDIGKPCSARRASSADTVSKGATRAVTHGRVRK